MTVLLAPYWIATVPAAITGMILLGMLKKLRDERAKKALVPATIPVERS